MSETVEIELHVLVGDDGEFVVAKDVDELVDLYAGEHGGVPVITRVFTVKLSVPRPGAITITAAVDKVEGPMRITVA